MEFDGVEFSLTENFLDKYKKRSVKWGPLGYFVYKRTYSRPLPNGKTEEWYQTVQRVVEGCFLIQKRHCKLLTIPWNERQAKNTAQVMYDLIWNFKFLPPGRGLWAMGTNFLFKKGSACLNNCAGISTEGISQDFSGPFTWLMDMSLLGVGVGFDTLGAKEGLLLKQPRILKSEVHVVEDSREGWVEVFRRILDSYVRKDTIPSAFDYTKIRSAGSKIHGFGGTAPGYKPLQTLVEKVTYLLDNYVDKALPVDSTLIVDLMNLAGEAVVSGGIRRTAEISLGNPNDLEFLNLKNSESINDKTKARWASNNSIICDVGQDYSEVAERASINGEPGIYWLNNARNHGRLIDGFNNIDHKVCAINPCQPANAKILTPNGISTIGNIQKGSVIWSGSKWTTVVNKWSTGIKSVYKYTTSRGEFIGTSNHKILSKGKKLEVGKVADIDSVVGPETNCTCIPQLVMDGLVLGDGSVHKASNNLLFLHIGKKDLDYFDSEISNLIIKHRLGLADTAYEINTTLKWNEVPKTYDRSIPGRYYYASALEVQSFLRGLFSANGSVVNSHSSKRSRVTLKQSSYVLIRQVQELLSSVGIGSYITTNKKTWTTHKNGHYESRKSYALNISIQSDIDLFYKNIGFIQRYKTPKYSGGLKATSSAIQHIEFLGNEEVFDITVDCTEHTYWTGGLLASNCGEQPLENKELCCLVETFPSLHNTLEEYLFTVKYAYLYAKTVTLLPTHDERTNAVMFRNRRIGLSQTGVVESINKIGFRTHLNWSDKGYKAVRDWDRIYSDWLCVPRSIKVTTVKPSGSVSLLPGVLPGIHFGHSKYYTRRIRINKNSTTPEIMKKAGYHVEPDTYENENTMIVEFPVYEPNFSLRKDQVSIWEQLELAAQMQAYWSDNAVSITVTIPPGQEKDLSRALSMYEGRLKSVSFLPLRGDTVYTQAPYEALTPEAYRQAVGKLKPYKLDVSEEDRIEEKFCTNDTCEIK